MTRRRNSDFDAAYVRVMEYRGWNLGILPIHVALLGFFGLPVANMR